MDDYELVIMENLNEKLQKYEESKGVFDVLPAKGLHEYCGRRFESEERILCNHLGYVGPSHPKYPLEDYCSARIYTEDQNNFIYRRYYQYKCLDKINSISEFNLKTK